MNNTSHNNGAIDKVKGQADEAIGKIKEKVGAVLGDHELEAKGQVQNAEGKAQRIKGEMKEAIDDAVVKVKAGVEVVSEKIKETIHKH